MDKLKQKYSDRLISSINKQSSGVPLVSVLIPTHNRKDMIERLIKNVQNSTYPNIEITVIDDKSEDGTVASLQQTFGIQIKIIQNSVNSGVACSRNMGIAQARGEYIFLVDDDNVVDEHCIARLVDFLEKEKDILMAGPVMMFLKEPTRVWWAGTERNMTTSRTHFLFTKGLPEYENWSTADFPNAWMYRASLREYTSFDESLYMHYEESDFAYRLHKRVQGRYAVLKSAVVYHDIGDNVEDVRRRWSDEKRVFYTARNRVIFHKRYSTPYELLQFLVLWNWAFTAYYLYFISGLDLGAKRNNISMAKAYLKGVVIGLTTKS